MTRQPTRTPRPGAAPRSPSPAPANPAAAAPSNPAPRRPTVEQIRKRAYEIYLARRGVGGSPEQDWLQAERELTRELGGW
jgi:hypothetical protein